MISDNTQQLIDHLWDFNNPAASETRFREAIAHSSDEAQVLELQTQLARALGLQDKFEDAHELLDQVDHAVAIHNEAEFATVRVRSLLERGRVCNSSRQRTTALPLFEQAFDLAHQITNDHLAIDAAHMIAIAHGADQRSDESMRWNRTGLELADGSSQPRARQWRGSLHNNIGWTLHGKCEYSSALRHFEIALACRLEQNKPEEIRIARWCTARCLRSLNRINEALAIQQQILQQIRDDGDPPDGFVHEELGECLLALGRNDEARPHFARAYHMLSANTQLRERDEARMNRLALLAELQTPE